RLVAQVSDAVDSPSAYRVSDPFYYRRDIHAIRDVGDYDSRHLLRLLDLRVCADRDLSAPRLLIIADVRESSNGRASGEVRPFDMRLKIADRRVGMIDQMGQRSYHSTQIVRRDVCIVGRCAVD